MSGTAPAPAAAPAAGRERKRQRLQTGQVTGQVVPMMGGAGSMGSMGNMGSMAGMNTMGMMGGIGMPGVGMAGMQGMMNPMASTMNPAMNPTMTNPVMNPMNAMMALHQQQQDTAPAPAPPAAVVSMSPPANVPPPVPAPVESMEVDQESDGAMSDVEHDESGSGQSIVSNTTTAVQQAALVPCEGRASQVGGGLPSLPEADEMVARRNVEAFISRSCTYVKYIPRSRLSECMELICPALDSTYTSECSQTGLLALLWLFCRVKPVVKLTDLRSLYYIIISCLQ